jgi:dTDP-4-dehydrorhamnose 3,5-epimerase
VTIVDIEPHRDYRGFFSCLFCADEFAECGLNSTVAQANISFNYTRGTLRSLRRQMPPYAGAKLVRCTRGAIVDVAVDVRPESQTYRRHVMVQLSADNHRALFVPPYVAHGFQTLANKTEAICQVSGRYKPAGEQGFRWSRIAEVPRLEMPRRTGNFNLRAVRDGTRVLRTVLRDHRAGMSGRLVQAMREHRSAARATSARATPVKLHECQSACDSAAWFPSEFDWLWDAGYGAIRGDSVVSRARRERIRDSAIMRVSMASPVSKK